MYSNLIKNYYFYLWTTVKDNPPMFSFITLVWELKLGVGAAKIKLLLTHGSRGPKFVPKTHPELDPHQPKI